MFKTYLLLIIVILTGETLFPGAGFAAFAGDGFDFLLGTVGEVARVGVVGGHFCCVEGWGVGLKNGLVVVRLGLMLID